MDLDWLPHCTDERIIMAMILTDIAANENPEKVKYWELGFSSRKEAVEFLYEDMILKAQAGIKRICEIKGGLSE